MAGRGEREGKPRPRRGARPWRGRPVSGAVVGRHEALSLRACEKARGGPRRSRAGAQRGRIAGGRQGPRAEPAGLDSGFGVLF